MSGRPRRPTGSGTGDIRDADRSLRRGSGDAVDEYGRRLDARRARAAACDRRHLIHGNLRVAVAVVAIVLAVAAFDQQWLSGWWLLVPAVAFLWLGSRLQRLEEEGVRLSRAIVLYERALARLDGRWAGDGPSGERFLDDDHLYAGDLDLFGEGSLFELLCRARTRMGEEALASWLLEPASPDVVEARQRATVELAPRLDLREDLAVLGEDAGAGVRPEPLTSWAERQPVLGGSRFRAVAVGLSALGLIAVLLAPVYVVARLGMIELGAATTALSGIYLLSVVVASAGVAWRLKSRTDRVLREAEVAAHDLDLLADVLERLEAERFSAPGLVALRQRLRTEGRPPSRQVDRLDRLMDLVASRGNLLVRLLGPLVLWDLHLAYALESWRRTAGPALRRWLEAVGEIEALASLAAYRYEHPRDVFPELTPGSTPDAPVLEGEGLAHPLLDEREAVPNDVRLGGDLQLLVVSGSNMSGKTTLLRTVGANAVLAQAGAPVRARSLRLSPLAVAASIRIHDSLQEGTSRFYAEIRRLRAIFDRAGDEPPVLFLIDELLHGTNSHDRRVGAEAIVRGLVDRGAIGLVTTHDLALAEVADALGPRAANVHFVDELDDGRLRFDYRLRPGVVREGNAIELMRSVGFEI